MVICEGDSAEIFGKLQFENGVYYDSLETTLGCDSVIVRELIVNPIYNIAVDVQICSGDSSFLSGAYQTTTGVYTDFFQTNNGCDSVVVTTLNVVNSIETSFEVTICEGESYDFGGTSYTAAGSYNDTLTAQAGCDSISTLILTVNPIYTVPETVEICDGDDYAIANSIYSVSGTYKDTLQTTLGCDSIIETTLIVNPNYAISNDLTICEGDSLLIDGNYETTAGTYYELYETTTGCDSIIETNLSVSPIIELIVEAQICSGDSLLINGSYQTTTGVYIDSSQTTAGCDSVVITDLSVSNEIITQTETTICDGDSILIGGNYYFDEGVYHSDTLTAQAGCDSIITVELSLEISDTTYFEVQICTGDSFLIGGNYEKTAGIYYEPSTSICQDESEVELTIADTIKNYSTFTFCEGDSADILGTYYTESIIVTDTQFFSTCPSITYYSAEMTPAVEITAQTVAICEGDGYVAGGFLQTNSGMYYDTLIAASGCDSIIETILNINNPVFTTQTIAICNGDSILLEGAYQTNAGIFTDVYQGVNTCDSVVTTTLVINNSIAVQTTAEICEGDSILLGGSYQSTAGVYTDTYQAANSCDSIVETTLTIKPVITVQETAEICEGDSILLGGSFQSAAGTYEDRYNGANGCDSIVETTLTILPVSFIQTSVAICDGELAELPDGRFESNAGVYTITLQSTNSCDSIVEVTLTVNDNYSSTIDTTICEGDSILLSGAYQTIAGSYTDAYTTTNNCDSVIITQLAVSTTGMCGPTSIANINSRFDLSLYPNPANNYLVIEQIGDEQITAVSISNTLGDVIKVISLNSTRKTVDLSNIATGLYFIQYEVGNTIRSQRIHVVK